MRDLLDYIKFMNGVINIKVITKSSENKIIFEDDLVKVKITDVPEDGKANKAIIELFHKELSLPKNNIKIIKGFTTSRKILCIKY